MGKNIQITPKTKVAEVLDNYPELEGTLIGLSPAFKKLKNPVLRRTIARVTSLQQAAAVGNVSVELIVNKLREAAGLDAYEDSMTNADYQGEQPSWFDGANISHSFDAREKIEGGEQPLGEILADLKDWEHGKIYELITPFLPAPLIDKVLEKGFLCWTKKMKSNLYRSYFIRKS